MREFDNLKRFLGEAGISGLKHALHVGGGNGREDADYRSLGIVPVYVEPDTRSLKALGRNVPGRKVLPYAFDDRNHDAILHATSLKEASSLLPPAKLLTKLYPKIKVVGRENVRCVAADSVANEIGNSPDLIVIDTQGYELRVLRGMKKLLKTARVVMVEVFHERMYEGSPLKGDIVRFMSGQGFRCAEEFPGHDAWGDAVFVREAEFRPKVTLFTTIMPQRPPQADRQYNALRSWSLLGPMFDVLVIGDNPGSREFAEGHGFRYAPHAMRSKRSPTLMFDDYFRAAKENIDTDLMMHVASDIVLMPDFERAITHLIDARRRRPELRDFVGIGKRYGVRIDGRIGFGPNWTNGMCAKVLPGGNIQKSAVNYCLFNRDLWDEWPPFIAWRTWEDYWWGFDALRRGVPLINMTKAFRAIHPVHKKHGHLSDEDTWAKEVEHNRRLRVELGMTKGYAPHVATWEMDQKGIRRIKATDAAKKPKPSKPHGPVITGLMKLVQHVSRYESVLNIGCGPTGFLRKVKAKERVGVDVCEKALQKARAKARNAKQDVRYVRGDLLQLRQMFLADSFDCVVGLDVLEHLAPEDAARVLDACDRIARYFVGFFIPVGYCPYSTDQYKLDNEYHMTHKSTWTPGMMAKRGYEVWHFSDWHKRHQRLAADSSRAAMWCAKPLADLRWHGAGKIHELIRFG